MLNRRSPARRCASRKGNGVAVSRRRYPQQDNGQTLAGGSSRSAPAVCGQNRCVDDCSYPLALRFHTAKRFFLLILRLLRLFFIVLRHFASVLKLATTIIIITFAVTSGVTGINAL